MAKGLRIKLPFHHFQDAETGANITRLTPPDVLCHRNYFYQKCFTRDGNHLLFAAEFDGNRNYYLLDLHQQEALQLTEGKGDNTFGGFLSDDDRYLWYVKNERSLQRVDLATLEETSIYQVPADWVGYGTWVANSDCTQLVGIEIAREDWEPLTDWQIFQRFFEKNPHCRLLRIDLKSGAAQIIHQQHLWLGHPIYRPHDNSTVAFCHEGPHDLIDARMWLINEDGSNMRKVKHHAPGESCTHEFWVPDGSALIYVSYHKDRPDRQICRFNPDTEYNEVLMTMPACSHLMSNENGTLLVGDGSGTPVDVQDTSGYTIDNDPWLYVFDVAQRSYFRLAAHNSSWRVLNGDRQVTHPHPSFTPDGRQVLFTSDYQGQPALYLAALPDPLTA
ncbi:oligogalacturonate lyase family protein [Erwiniaceae bacterium BAC15a-03b]|uniref:Oligogalacturonate lyase family protein n=1 Tax=Winslowiella arboricola TaxID=2978220 RepID=A0A9J6PSD5_9GAMM|nr:oligogalacturonate lyase family protein [Winslowiella arboricola]MCU5772083.1 oligogalacturonate lyase family protein [Winslowiella arboricola]MCU5778581.1 oligogalacturonate lyase family protein [Winslowiella arboricola]